MKFKRHLELERELRHIDIAPLIDVVFLLLIFFMLTSSFIIQPGIKINLPKAVTSEVMQEKGLVITINKDSVIYLDAEEVKPQDLSTALKKQSAANKQVLIKADKACPLGKIVNIWDLCRQSGVLKINIATLQETR
ncbi:MAG: biopolymer transporter ExbD [Candidatus Omnitrophota bacterium]